MTLKSFSSFAGITLLAVASASCGEFVQDQGRAPAQVVIQKLEGAQGNNPDELANPLISDVETVVTTPDPCSTTSPCHTVFNDVGEATMSLILKDPGQAGVVSKPSDLNAVTITRYRVEYSRADGHNTPGVDVPFPIDSAVTFTIPAEGAVAVPFELVRNTAKREAPLRNLLGGGLVLSTIAKVTFFGHDQAGNDVAVSASMGVNFGDFLP